MIKKHDVIYRGFGEALDRASYKNHPSVCLMIADSAVNEQLVVSSVKEAIAIGCSFFMFWGSYANTLHDVIDEIIESGSDEWLDIITTSHEGEPLCDVLDFLYTGAMPGNNTFRCLIIGDKSADELQLMISNCSTQ